LRSKSCLEPFIAVPAFILELPVTNSGPTTTSTGNWAVCDSGLPALQEILPVIILFSLQACKPITYGVVPDSDSYYNIFWIDLESCRSIQAGCIILCVFTALRIAASPPLWFQQQVKWYSKVGGHRKHRQRLRPEVQHRYKIIGPIFILSTTCILNFNLR
jgi:hypothetical protein